MLIHTSVELVSEQFYTELRRRVYTTPKSYLDLISLYLNTLDKKRIEINQNRNRLANGLNTLKSTNESIAELKVTITKMLPELAKSNEELAVTLEQVRKDKAVADEKERVVMIEKEIVEKKVAETKIIKDEVDADFALALPILENAKKIVDSIDKGSIQELKALNNPPAAVVMVMGCVVTMLGAKKIEWADIRQEINDPNAFIKKVLSFDVTTMSEVLLKKVRDKWFKMPEFNPKDVKSKSSPAGALCEWAIALSEF